jgi:single stranded DNA-binding protein
MNEIKLVGNVVKDPGVFDTKTGKMGRLRMAVNNRRGSGEDAKEEVLFIDVKLFGNTFKDLEYFDLSKGDRISVSGRLVMEEFVNKDGNAVKDYVIYAFSVLKIAKGTQKSTTTSSYSSDNDDVAF